jgi:uncharacterized protein YodC (DUF2158 family)
MIIPVPVVIAEWFLRLFGPQPKFKKGDSVQTTSGTELMVVQWIKVLDKSRIMYFCKWYDPVTRSTRTNIFKEDQLKQFDWYDSGASLREIPV